MEETRERLVSLKVSPRNLLVLQQELTASLFSPTPLVLSDPIALIPISVCVCACVRARARVCVCDFFSLFSVRALCISICNLFFSFLDICAFSRLSLCYLSFYMFMFCHYLRTLCFCFLYICSVPLSCFFSSISELFSVYVNFFFFFISPSLDTNNNVQFFTHELLQNRRSALVGGRGGKIGKLLFHSPLPLLSLPPQTTTR